jgi:hypothetical protein
MERFRQRTGGNWAEGAPAQATFTTSYVFVKAL